MRRIEANVMKNNVRNGKVAVHALLYFFIISIPIQLLFNLNLWFFTVFSGIASIFGHFVLKSKFHEAYISFHKSYFKYKNSFESQIKAITNPEIMYEIKMKGIKVNYKDIESINQTFNKINLNLKNGKRYELDLLEFGYKEIQEIKVEIEKLKTK